MSVTESLQTLNWLLFLPAFGAVLCLVTNYALEVQLWRILFFGKELIIAAVLMSGCLFISNIGTTKYFPELNVQVDVFCFLHMVKYTVILILLLLLTRKFLWDKRQKKILPRALLAFAILGLYSIFDVVQVIQSMP